METPTSSSSLARSSSSQDPSEVGAQQVDAVAVPSTDESQGTTTHDPKRRKLRSKAWLEFDRELLNGVWKAKCKWCKTLIGGETRNGTTHLHDHLAICQAKQCRKGLKQATLKVGKNVDGSVSVQKYIFDQDAATKELALMICLHEYPLSIVDHVGFRNFCAAMQPLFKVLTRNTIRKDIFYLHFVQSEALVKYFQKLTCRIAITTDMWTANHQKKGYMAVTAHFIDEKWNLKSFLLSFIYVPAPHTGEVIAVVLHGVLVDCHLERKVSTVTLDNCTTNDNMVVKMQDKLPLDSLLLDGAFLHMRCAAHILNLIVKDGMSILEKGVERVRDSVGFWSATPKRHERFEKMASQLNIAYNKRIGLDCPTRWNSTCIMLNTALEYQAVFERLTLREKLFSPICPNPNEWLFAKEVCSRLKLFLDISELLSGTTYVTANLFFPKVCSVYLAIRKWRASGHPRIEEMSALMKAKFDKYWTDVHGLMAVACVLDPRYKLHLLKAFFTSVYGTDHATIEVDKVRSMLYQLVIHYQQAAEEVATSSSANTSAAGAGQNSADTSADDELFNIFDQYMSSQPAVTSHVRTELDLYLEEPPVPRAQDLDIVNWWKYGEIKYPTLQCIARDILPIPVTTVASESAFSTSGRVLSPNRSSLAPKMIEALMCMQAWSRADMLDISTPAAIMTCNEEVEEEMEKSESTVTD